MSYSFRNLIAITVMAAIGISVLKMTAGFVPFEGYKSLVGNL